MSLTRLLQTYEGSYVLKPLMRHKPDGVHVGIMAPPRTRRYALVGTAFDYLMRWHVQHRYANKTKAIGEWVAETGATHVWNGYCFKTGQHERLIRRRGVTFGMGFPPETTEDIMKNTAEKVMRMLADGRSEHSRYLHTGSADRRTAEAVIGLAELDAIFRANYMEHLMKPDASPDPDDIEDLLSLHSSLVGSATMHSVLDKARSIRLNPTFGKYSRMVGGADADIIASDTLIDIKTTKFPTFKPDYWQQLLGYCALANASRGRHARIRRLGVYFSRFGVLRVVDAPDADWRQVAGKLAYAREKWLTRLQKESESAS